MMETPPVRARTWASLRVERWVFRRGGRPSINTPGPVSAKPNTPGPKPANQRTPPGWHRGLSLTHSACVARWVGQAACCLKRNSGRCR
jgi:hypothetical protein